MNISTHVTFFVLILLAALVVGFGVTYLGLLATQFLFGWPEVVTWKHTIATWLVLVIVGGLFRRK